VRGERKPNEERKAEVLHQGIAARSFDRRFQLADGVQVTGASLENGLLHLDLLREMPEAKKPKLIPISSNNAQAIEAQRAA
jgi:molecular chaperone IbpA